MTEDNPSIFTLVSASVSRLQLTDGPVENTHSLLCVSAGGHVYSRDGDYSELSGQVNWSAVYCQKLDVSPGCKIHMLMKMWENCFHVGLVKSTATMKMPSV